MKRLTALPAGVMVISLPISGAGVENFEPC